MRRLGVALLASLASGCISHPVLPRLPPDLQARVEQKPTHNPGFLLLSPAIPFWWTEPFGFRLTARNVASGAAAEIDTTREGTTVLWGPAPLLNVLPGRSWLYFEGRERDRIQAGLLEVVGE